MLIILKIPIYTYAMFKNSIKYENYIKYNFQNFVQ